MSAIEVATTAPRKESRVFIRQSIHQLRESRPTNSFFCMAVTALPEERATTDRELADFLAPLQDFQKETRSGL
jgi:hypothetical protein